MNNSKNLGAVVRITNQFNGTKGNNKPKSYTEQTANAIAETFIEGATILVCSIGLCKALSGLIGCLKNNKQ